MLWLILAVGAGVAIVPSFGLQQTPPPVTVTAIVRVTHAAEPTTHRRYRNRADDSELMASSCTRIFATIPRPGRGPSRLS